VEGVIGEVLLDDAFDVRRVERMPKRSVRNQRVAGIETPRRLGAGGEV
jgi:hypothetical protein